MLIVVLHNQEALALATWRPQPEDLQRVFDEQNPWHHSGHVPEILARPVERPLARRLWERVLNDDPRRFQLILGPRRVGKTTVMCQTPPPSFDRRG
ncbi:MAG: hypothetical protein ACRD0K_28260 [Egibacteraceae bacterium]